MFGSKSVMKKSMSEKTFEKTFSSLKKMKSGKNGKTIEGLKDQFVETNKLGHRTRIQLGRSPSWIDQSPSSPCPRNSSPKDCIELILVSSRSEVSLELYNFKIVKYSFL
ncbi:hypothetical protein F2Q69_00042221 [Brassica cretica]|uniref:Uncharacterized protein n=1 Tax=Brassica cretica TaxID=69181 RepID=A0A8S9N252_BRACR|nr:hypothetical protein F2Q69_00042221 [Brassica cretica]